MQIPRLTTGMPTVPLLVVSIVLAGCTASGEESAQTYKPTVEVLEISSGLEQEFSVTGEVTPFKRADFTAEFRASVEDIYVKPGEKVQEGQILVTLNAPNIAQRYSTAANSYSTANLNLDQTKLNAQKAVEASEAALRTAEENLRNTLALNEEKRKQAEEVYNAAKVSLELNVGSAETELQNAIRSTETTVDSAVTAMDVLLEASQLHTDNDNMHETHIGVRDPTFVYDAKIRLVQNRNTLLAFQPTQENAFALLQQTENMLIDVLKVLKNSVTSPEYTQSSLDSDIGRINGELSSVRTLISKFETTKRALDSAKQMNGGPISQAILNAKATYDTTLSDLDASDQRAKRQVEEAKIALQSAKTSAGISELGARTSLTSVSGELMQARLEKDKLVIRAPFAGIIADVPVKIGTTVQSGDAVVSVEDSGTLKIITYLSASQVRRVHVGDSVQIGEKSKDTISAIAPSADSATKKYKVEILHQNAHLKPGEFISIRFIGQENSTEKTEDVEPRIFVPISAVQLLSNETYVWTVHGNTVQKALVTLGNIEGELVEVTYGLKDGDIIVIEGGRVIEDEGTEVRVSDAVS